MPRLFFCTLLMASGTLFLHAETTPPKQQSRYAAFTGKVTANKVRLRVKPDRESPVLRQAVKDDLFLIVGEAGDFYAVEPPPGVKAYVFRSYVLDGIVEAGRVNIRLEPHTDSPILGQLQLGDKVQGEVSSLNHKWLEIDPPSSVRFYIAKEYVEKAGGPEYLALMSKRKAEAENLLAQAYSLAEEECKKDFEAMKPETAIGLFQTLLKNYLDFPECIAQAKQGLALIKETYLQKKLAYLEAKVGLSETLKQEIIAKHKEENRDLFSEVALLDGKKRPKKIPQTDAMRVWNTLEDALYLSWAPFHHEKSREEFYEEQLANAILLTGTVEPYTHSVQEKPGDYLLKRNGHPVAYLYSTQVDLSQLSGKEVSLLAAPRQNNHFAFPAYFVLKQEN